MEEPRQPTESTVDPQTVQDAMQRQKAAQQRHLGCVFAIFTLPLICGCVLLGSFWPVEEYDGPGYNLDTNGLSVTTHYSRSAGWEPFDSREILNKHRDVEFKIEQLNSGNHLIRVRAAKVKSSHEGFSISSPVWSAKHNLLFFFEQSRPDSNGGNSTRIWQWKPSQGFQPVTNSYPRIDELSLSLDEEQVTAIIDPYNDDGQKRLLSYSVDGRFEKSLPCPDDADGILVIGPDRYFVTKYDGNSHESEVWLEQPNHRPLKVNIGGKITTVIAFEGNIYALRKQEPKVEVVKLNKTLTGVEENFGLIH